MKGFERMRKMKINYGLHELAALMLAIWGMALTVVAEPMVTDVTARQRYPWNGLVDIDVTFTGAGLSTVSFEVKDVAGNTNLNAQTFYLGNPEQNVRTLEVQPGTHRFVWDAAADLGQVEIPSFAVSAKVMEKTFEVNVTDGTGAGTFAQGSSVSIAANKAGYTFTSWSGAGTDVALLLSATAVSTTLIMPSRDVAYEATYTPNTYSVKFNANGGSGTMANESFTYGTAKALTANAFTREGYTFQGWATSASGSKAYNDKQSVSNLATTSGAVVNLYAVWDYEKVQLWANGPYWATINVGASKTTGYGYYFWWGDTIGYKRQNNKWVASDGSSSNFSFNPNTAPTYGKTFAKLYSGGWTTTSSESSAKLVTKHDAARAHWGGSWRMPTKSDFAGLSEKCTYESTTINGVKGYIYKGKGSYANKSIFLPGAGHANNTGYGDNFDSVAGLTIPDVQYWSSNPDIGGNYSDYGTEGAISHFGFSYRNYRYYGRPIRPVCSP